jgi:hypothetical protein
MFKLYLSNEIEVFSATTRSRKEHKVKLDGDTPVIAEVPNRAAALPGLHPAVTVSLHTATVLDGVPCPTPML